MQWRFALTMTLLFCIFVARVESSRSTGSSFLRLFSLSSEPDGAEPRCGRDFGGIRCDDAKLARYGECCSKYGFCGRKPFHCVERLGCQSTCNNDLDVKSDNETAYTEQPTSVVPRPPDFNHPKVIIKSVQAAIPLCDKCAPQTAPKKTKKKSDTSVHEPKHRFSTAMVEGLVRAQTLLALGAPPTLDTRTPGGRPGSGVPVPPAGQTITPADKQNPHPIPLRPLLKYPEDDRTAALHPESSTSEEQSEEDKFKQAMKQLKDLETAAEKKAQEIIKHAQDVATNVTGNNTTGCANCVRKVIVADFRPKRRLNVLVREDDDPMENPLDPRGY